MKRLTKLQRHEEVRKLFHISAGCAIAISSLYLDRSTLILLLMGGLVLDIASRWLIEQILPGLKHKKYPRHSISFGRIIGLVLRTLDNMNDVGRRSYGDYAYIAGIVVSALLFEQPFTFIMACLALALGDGMAGLIGRIFGRHHYSWFGADKTYLGSTVFFLLTSFVAWQLLIASQVPVVNASLGAVVIAIPTTILEAAIGYGFDNFAVPLAAGLLFELMV